MKKILIMLAMLLCVASGCFAAEERTTKEIFADASIADVVITGRAADSALFLAPIWMVISLRS